MYNDYNMNESIFTQNNVCRLHWKYTVYNVVIYICSASINYFDFNKVQSVFIFNTAKIKLVNLLFISFIYF